MLGWIDFRKERFTMRKYLQRCGLIGLAFLFSTLHPYSAVSANSALDVPQGTNHSIPSDINEISIEFALPRSVTLANNQDVSWNVTSVVVADANGGECQGVIAGKDGRYFYNHCGLNYSLESFLRISTLKVSAEFAGKFAITVTANTKGISFQNTVNLKFETNSSRVPLVYSKDDAPQITFQSPDVGSDKQTMVTFSAKWNRTLPTSITPGIGHWVKMYVVDSRGRTIPQCWTCSNPSSIFWGDDTLADGSGKTVIKLPIGYSDYMKAGGLFIALDWQLNGQNFVGESQKRINIRSIFEIPVNFPKTTPQLKTSCTDVYKDEYGNCEIVLNYLDSTGASAFGGDLDLVWSISDSSGKLIKSGAETVRVGIPITIPLPVGISPLTLKAEAPGTMLRSEAKATPHDYETHALNSLEILTQCIDSVGLNTLTCYVQTSTQKKADMILDLSLIAKIDGKSWVTLKNFKAELNDSKLINFPVKFRKVLSIKAVARYRGKTFVSEIQKVNKTQLQSSSSSDANVQGINLDKLPVGRKGSYEYKVGQEQARDYTSTPGMGRNIVGQLGGINRYCKFILETFVTLRVSNSSATKQQYADFLAGCLNIVKPWY